MTTDLTIQNLFEGKPIRITRDLLGEVWISTNDLAAAWGIDRTTPHNLIMRNQKIFSGMFVSDYGGDVTSPTGDCVNERGLYLLMGKISASRLKNPASKEVIIRFQRWVPELIQQYRKKEIVQVPKGPDYAGIIERMKFVRAVHEETGWNLLELQKEVLREAGMISLTYHIEPEQKKIPYPPVSLPKPKNYLTAKDIGERIGKSAHEVYMFLYNNHLLIMSPPGGWRLTEAGKAYGSEYAVEVGQGAIVWRIRWKKDILRLFNVFDHGEMG